MLEKVFPDEKIPDLRELERRVALSITLGNTFLSDGLRPLLPNTILAGLMSCKGGGQGLPQDLQVKIQPDTIPSYFIMVSDVTEVTLNSVNSVNSDASRRVAEALPRAAAGIRGVVAVPLDRV